MKGVIMTVLFYKVGDLFTKSYFEAQGEFIKTHNKIEKCYVEFPYVDNLEDINKVTIEDLKEKYNKKEVRFN